MAIESSNELRSPLEPLQIQEAPIELTFEETLPTLQEMSSLAVALALWRQVIRETNDSDYDFITETNVQAFQKLLLEIPAPRLIRDFIGRYSEHVRKEMNDWLSSSIPVGFTYSNINHNKSDLLFCRWHSDGKINLRASALNMLSGAEIGQIQKFKIMCRYCLVDEIDKLPADSLPSYLTESILFSNNALIFYWLCYMRGELNKIPRSNDESIASCMITASGVDTWSAIEYFWNQLDVLEQTYKMSEILEKNPKCQLNLLSKICESQKFHLFSQKPVQIMKNFWNTPGQERFAFQTWIYIKDIVDASKFQKILVFLLYSESSSSIELQMEYLANIWKQCPDRLRNLAYNSVRSFISDTITTLYHNSFQTYNPKRVSIEFLATFLSYASPEFRRKFMFKKLLPYSNIPIDALAIEELIELCLPNANDIVKFKKEVLESPYFEDNFCDFMMRNDDCERFCKFFDCYYPDTSTRIEFCRKILVVLTEQHFRVDGWIKVLKLMEENIFLDRPDEWLELKKRVTMMVADRFTSIWSSWDSISELIQIVMQVLDGEEQEEFKRKALNRVEKGKLSEWVLASESALDGFFSWCWNNDAGKVREFKKKLSIAIMFEGKWESVKSYAGFWRMPDVDEKYLREQYEYLNGFLFWYFEDVEEVKKFKLEKVFEYCDIHTMMFSRYGDEDNTDVFTRAMLPWFFEGNRNIIQVFKETFKYQKFVHMI